MPYDNDGEYYDAYTDSMYGGAPDECSLHWPTKFDDKGNCPECTTH